MILPLSTFLTRSVRAGFAGPLALAAGPSALARAPLGQGAFGAAPGFAFCFGAIWLNLTRRAAPQTKTTDLKFKVV